MTPHLTHRPVARPVARPAVRPRVRLTLRAALGACLAAGLAAAPAAAQSRPVARAAVGRPAPALPAGTAPDPRLAADEVVGIVLTALAQAGDRPAGDAAEDTRPFALAFAFSSPANRAMVGTLERFSEMVHDDAYRPLLGHRGVTRGAMRVTGDRATQRVVVTGADGERVAYTFSLGRQAAGAFRGCWMTDSVVREAPSRLVAPQSA
jgi:hypothetical protein